MTADEMLELVETIHKAILPLGYEVITGHEEGDIFHLVLKMHRIYNLYL